MDVRRGVNADVDPPRLGREAFDDRETARDAEGVAGPWLSADGVRGLNPGARDPTLVMG